MIKLKKEYINKDIHFGNPLGIEMNTNSIYDKELFNKWYPFLFDICECEVICECNCDGNDLKLEYKKKK